MSNRNSKMFSLFVFCLIISGLFFTNINNNVLGGHIQREYKILQDPQKNSVINLIMKNMSVDDEQKDELQDYLSQLWSQQGWRIAKHTSRPEKYLVDKNLKRIIFPFIVNMKDKRGVIFDMQCLDVHKNYLERTFIVLQYIHILPNNNGLNTLRFSPYHIHSMLSEMFRTFMQKYLLDKKGIRWNNDTDCLHLIKFFQDTQWKILLGYEHDQGNRRISFMFQDEDTTPIYNNVTSVYNATYKYVDPSFILKKPDVEPDLKINNDSNKTEINEALKSTENNNGILGSITVLKQIDNPNNEDKRNNVIDQTIPQENNNSNEEEIKEASNNKNKKRIKPIKKNKKKNTKKKKNI
jgi:hypothetical protein